MMDLSAELLQSAVADRYQVERELGRGGMAAVYLARDLKHGRAVAIKVVLPGIIASIGPARFLQEIRIAAGLSHPNILPLHDSGEAAGLPYYVMPFVEGETLRDLLTREQQLTIADSIRIATDIAGALGHAHSLGLVHRDIKPDNILLSGGRAVVADFGIARALSAAGERLTQTGLAVGTPAYMSPEQAAGSPVIDGRSDIYSLGCVLYEMLVGQPPFTGPTPQAVMARHSIDAVPPLRTVRPGIPEALEEIVLCALAKTPGDRFRTAAELLEALAGLHSGGFLVAQSGYRPSGARVTAPSPARSVMAVVVAVTLLGGGLVGWILLGARGGGAGDDIAPDPRDIAVLYFSDRTPAADLGYLADGLTEALIHHLSQVPPLRVVSRHGVGPFRGAPVTPDSIRRSLGVGTVVDGSVARSGDRIRVTVAIVDPLTGVQVGTRTVERDYDEIFALEDDLTAEVARFLRGRLGEEVRLRERRAGTRNADAWRLTQEAEQAQKDANRLLEAGDLAAAARQLLVADSMLAHAEALDPRWAVPPTQRGWIAYRQARLGGFDEAHNNRWTRDALVHADRALRLARDDPDALDLRGTLRYWRYLLELDPPSSRDDAEVDFLAAVAANPYHASALNSLSHLHMRKEEYAEAKLVALRSYEADPYLLNADVTVWRLFQTSLELEDRREAMRWCDEGRVRFPANPRFVECRLWLFGLRDYPPDVPEAWRLLARYVDLSDPSVREFRRLRGEMMVAIALARAGLPDSARRVAERYRSTPVIEGERTELASFEAIVQTMVGDHSEAIQLLAASRGVTPDSVCRSLPRSWWYRGLRCD